MNGKIGFTGTRDGMTRLQADAFHRFICEMAFFTEFHHGDCVGADDEAATAVAEIMQGDEFIGGFILVCHPPLDEKLRAFNAAPLNVVTVAPKTHFARNRDIVDACDVLIVCPKQMERQSYGGTWYTHDYAVTKNKKVVVIWPNGDVGDAP